MTAVGLATGSVCGLISMTAGCGFCPAWSSLIIGFLGGIFSNLFIRGREKYHWFDDALDVFGCHGICGTWGVFAAGLWAYESDSTTDIEGGFFGRGKLIGFQLAGIGAVAAWSFVITILIGVAMKSAGILRVNIFEEEEGLDGTTIYPETPISTQVSPTCRTKPS